MRDWWLMVSRQQNPSCLTLLPYMMDHAEADVVKFFVSGNRTAICQNWRFIQAFSPYLAKRLPSMTSKINAEDHSARKVDTLDVGRCRYVIFQTSKLLEITELSPSKEVLRNKCEIAKIIHNVVMLLLFICDLMQDYPGWIAFDQAGPDCNRLVRRNDALNRFAPAWRRGTSDGVRHMLLSSSVGKSANSVRFLHILVESIISLTITTS